MKLTKAYNNRRFMMSDEARGVRLLSEYLEPKARLEAAGVRRAIAFFGSARIVPNPKAQHDYYARAADLAEQVARWTVDAHPVNARYHLVSGGGPGIMRAVSEGGARVDRRLNVGLNISLPHEQHVNPFVLPAQAFEFHYFFMRKFWFMNLAHAVVAFPGGFGTMDEIFEVLTLAQTGKITPRPIVLYGRAFWRKTIDFRGLAAAGLIDATDTQMFKVTDSLDEAVAHLTRGLDP